MRKQYLIFYLLLLTLCLVNQTFSQRKSVSNKEVTGTFKTADGTNSVKIFPVGKGGLDNPGYNLQLEFFASIKLGPNGNSNGNTGTLSGYAPIKGDTATFTPEGMEYEKCTITLKFVKAGVLKVTQKGDCGFVSDVITTEGLYKKVSSAKPKFTE